MAKETPPKNTGLANDLINEANKQSGAVDQGAVKQDAQNLADPTKGIADNLQAAIPPPIKHPASSDDAGNSEPNEGGEQYGSTLKMRGYPDQIDATSEEVEDALIELIVNRRRRMQAQLTEKKELAGDLAPTELDAQREKKYGPGYVVARKGKDEQIFTAVAWGRMVADKKGEKDGWRQVVGEPDEVKRLKALKK